MHLIKLLHLLFFNRQLFIIFISFSRVSLLISIMNLAITCENSKHPAMTKQFHLMLSRVTILPNFLKLFNYTSWNDAYRTNDSESPNNLINFLAQLSKNSLHFKIVAITPLNSLFHFHSNVAIWKACIRSPSP